MPVVTIPEQERQKIKELNNYLQNIVAEEERVKRELRALIYKIEKLS